VAYAPDGKSIATGGADQTMRLWETATGKELTSLKGRVGAVHAVAYSPDGRVIARGTENKLVQVWAPGIDQ
jgi:WD40 repeat protein